MEKLTRANLFRYVANENNRPYLEKLLIDYEKVVELFRDSEFIMGQIENRFIINHKRDFSGFLEMVFELIDRIKNEEFRFFLRKELSEIEKPLDQNSFNKAFALLINAISKFQNKIITDNFLPGSINSLDIGISCYPQTFLSYAYDDKGISLCLFLYFLINKGFLYVDWMWNKELSGVEIKEKMFKQLEKSKYFLFLRTPNSEFPYKHGRNMIREWCSWEIGCFYKGRLPGRKFYTCFYEYSKPKNDLLSDFKAADIVENGEIIEY